MSAPELLTLAVQRPANGGTAIAHAPDGRVVFVRGAIPGETVTASIIGEKPGFLSAEVCDVLDPSPYRIENRCPAAVHGAGCCDFAFVAAAHARTLKSQVLRDVLIRVGGFTPDALDVLEDAAAAVRALDDAEVGWRIRTRLTVDADGRAGVHERGAAGIVVGHPCAQPDPTMIVGVDAGYTPGAELAIVLDDDGHRHITELAPPSPGGGSGSSGRRRATQRRGTDRRGADRRSAQRRRRGREGARALTVLEGEATAVHRVGDRAWQIPVTGFWQGHRAAPSVYAATVTEFVRRYLEYVGVGSGEPVTCWDLYGGAGVFAAALLDDVGAGRVDIVDSDGGALAAAGVTFGDDPRVRSHRGEVAEIIGDLPAPDVVVLDPPRTGAGARVIDGIVAAGPRVVVHVGCDVGRFARDLRLWTDRGYRVRGIAGFDAFPLTHHLEAIAVLVRSTSPV
ncbi:TRAM domain-containing protein [Gordonia sp. VNQ95]|uniref:class I SAM-dependent RNA methyltransferase n=1 Tax=Gordonia sp. VNQ95 TaxID=3156619 RepID=UPI0032B5FAC5